MWNIDLVFKELKKQKSNGKTQRGLAEFCGIEEQKVSDWKAKRIRIAWLEYIPKIAEYLNVPPSTFNDAYETEKPVTISDDGQREIYEIVRQLSPENREKLLELSRMYLDAQNNKKEN